MQVPTQAMLLWIFIGENDRAEDRPLYEAIVLKARGGTRRGNRMARRHRLRKVERPAHHEASSLCPRTCR